MNIYQFKEKRFRKIYDPMSFENSLNKSMRVFEFRYSDINFTKNKSVLKSCEKRQFCNSYN